MMLNRLVGSAVVAMALLVVAATFDAADARGRGGARAFHGGSYARSYSGRAFSGRAVHAHRFRGGRFVRRGDRPRRSRRATRLWRVLLRLWRQLRLASAQGARHRQRLLVEPLLRLPRRLRLLTVTTLWGEPRGARVARSRVVRLRLGPRLMPGGGGQARCAGAIGKAGRQTRAARECCRQLLRSDRVP